MNTQNIKLNKFYLIIALALAGWFTYATLHGIAYWESGDVALNTEYHSTGGGHHGGGYGAHFYHK